LVDPALVVTAATVIKERRGNSMMTHKLFSVKMRASREGEHISGAEGIYAEEAINDAVSVYMERAFCHVKGMPDRLKIKVRALRREPSVIPLLDVMTMKNASVAAARNAIWELLCHLGVSNGSIRAALDIVYHRPVMRGASVMNALDGVRLEHDPQRGVRVTEIGIAPEAGEELSKRLDVFGLNTDTVREAVILASKVARHDDVLAELCVSDDPDYTTGYVASSELGYIRIPHIKEYGDPAGGRVFFVRDGASLDRLFDYLERTPVMIDRICGIRGEVPQSELFGDIAG